MMNWLRRAFGWRQVGNQPPFPNVIISVRPRKDTPLWTAAGEAIDVASSLGQDVEFVFDGVTLIVAANETARAIEERHAKHKR